MALDEPKDTDEVIESEEFRIVVEKALLERYSDLHVDYRKSPWFEGITIRCATPRPSC